jgi:hypothetical protein
MDHKAFAERLASGQISVRVDKAKAGYFYGVPGLMPSGTKKLQAIIRFAAFGGVGLGLVLFFVAPWWAAILVLFFGLYMFPHAQKSAATGVLSAAKLDPRVYELAMANGVFLISDT